MTICLWCLVTQETYHKIADRFGVSEATAHAVVMRVCVALCHLLPQVIVWPKSTEHISYVERGFRERVVFLESLALLAIGGSHINIVPPVDDEQTYNSRKKRHSIQLQAACDSNLLFTDIYTGVLVLHMIAMFFKICHCMMLPPTATMILSLVTPSS